MRVRKASAGTQVGGVGGEEGPAELSKQARSLPVQECGVGAGCCVKGGHCFHQACSGSEQVGASGGCPLKLGSSLSRML